MELWDEEMRRYEPVLEEDVTDRDRFAIALDGLGWVLATTEQPIEDERSRSYVERTLAYCRSAYQQGRTLAEGTPALLDELYAEADRSDEPGVLGIVRALGLCFDELAEALTARRTLEVLSRAYGFDLIRTCPDPIVTRAFEVRSPRMREILDYQHALLSRYTGEV